VQQAWVLPRFEGLSATEAVRRIIRDGIVDGSVPPGAQLRESRLATMLGTSRGTVREAVRQLVQEGLVEYRMHRGAFVRSQVLADLLDVYVAREAIEVWAAKKLIEVEDIDFSTLDAAISRMRAKDSRRTRPSEETIAADLQFTTSSSALQEVNGLPALTRRLRRKPGFCCGRTRPTPGERMPATIRSWWTLFGAATPWPPTWRPSTSAFPRASSAAPRGGRERPGATAHPIGRQPVLQAPARKRRRRNRVAPEVQAQRRETTGMKERPSPTPDDSGSSPALWSPAAPPARPVRRRPRAPPRRGAVTSGSASPGGAPRTSSTVRPSSRSRTRRGWWPGSRR
jgi:DNA-binding transcriptional regulator YhcF (GntR family)